NQVKGLRQMLLNRGSIKVLHELKNRANDDETRASVDMISEEVMRNLESSLGVSGLKPICLFRQWGELVDTLSERIKLMRSDMYVASRYVDFRTAETALQSASRGCSIKLLHSNRRALSERLQIFGNIMANPKSIFTFKNLVSNPHISMKKAYIPYSFIIIDSIDVGIEIVNPADPHSFFVGLRFESPSLARTLKEYFDILWTTAEKDDMALMFERPTTEILKELEASYNAGNKGMDTNHSL
ncbi:MAG: hypothetical protein V3W09_00965, partial [Nitrososphaerales archaeon]